MKRTYHPPHAEEVRVEINKAILTLSIKAMNDNGDGEGVDKFDTDRQRNDWDNIWSNME